MGMIQIKGTDHRCNDIQIVTANFDGEWGIVIRLECECGAVAVTNTSPRVAREIASKLEEFADRVDLISDCVGTA